MKIRQISEGILNEGGLSRALHHMQNNYFAILTAYRVGFTPAQNQARNGQLEQDMRTINAGGIKLIGHWQEAPDGEWYGHNIGDVDPKLLVDTTEESYLVPKPQHMTPDAFQDWVLQEITKFNQDAAVLGSPIGVFLLDKASGLTEIGKQVTVDKISQAYSTIKKKNFVFEGTMSPSNNAHKMLLKQRHIAWYPKN